MLQAPRITMGAGAPSMRFSRRKLLAGMMSAAAMAQDAPRTWARQPSKPRTTPAVCLDSKAVIKVEYDSLGMVLRDLGFDGCDLSVEPGGHVPPEQASADLMRAIEAINGVGLELPILSTNITSAVDPNGRQVLGIAGFMQIPLLRPGYWKYNNAADLDARVSEVQRETMTLASVA